MISKKELDISINNICKRVEKLEREAIIERFDVVDGHGGGVWVTGYTKNTLADEVKEINKKLDMLFDYLNVEIESFPPSKKIVKRKND